MTIIIKLCTEKIWFQELAIYFNQLYHRIDYDNNANIWIDIKLHTWVFNHYLKGYYKKNQTLIQSNIQQASIITFNIYKIPCYMHTSAKAGEKQTPSGLVARPI